MRLLFAADELALPIALSLPRPVYQTDDFQMLRAAEEAEASSHHYYHYHCYRHADDQSPEWGRTDTEMVHVVLAAWIGVIAVALLDY